MKFLILFVFAALLPFMSLAAVNPAHQTNVSVIELASITADGDVFGILLPRHSRIVSAYVVNGATIGASDTDYFQLSLQLGSTVIAELDSRAAHENGVTANVPKKMNVVLAQSKLSPGSYLKATYNEEGTMAMTNAKLIVEWYPL